MAICEFVKVCTCSRCDAFHVIPDGEYPGGDYPNRCGLCGNLLQFYENQPSLSGVLAIFRETVRVSENVM